ncbi:hypothetical protein [Microbacterium ulmi]|uniref:Uncharacterized protein n=1 Tax=Microbacterium ulmi TaxID=179095 RepID=A0A7Y2Q0U3_9MICO|nr:hypothetical protein [Microbacterium ulmi]NII69778.1 hypothetical protein [Microbacterium ulmi]NNH03250.1 hypothetical protein [Microbacterium ulmi]
MAKWTEEMQETARRHGEAALRRAAEQTQRQESARATMAGMRASAQESGRLAVFDLAEELLGPYFWFTPVGGAIALAAAQSGPLVVALRLMPAAEGPAGELPFAVDPAATVEALEARDAYWETDAAAVLAALPPLSSVSAWPGTRQGLFTARGLEDFAEFLAGCERRAAEARAASERAALLEAGSLGFDVPPL